MAWAMSSAVRVPVPLKSMCSTKCAMPLFCCGSCREPRASHTPMLTERTCGIRSVKSRRPLGSTSRTMAASDTLANWGTAKPLTDRSLEERRHLITRRARVTITCSHLIENARHSMSLERLDLAELDPSELEAALEVRGVQRYHARQLFRWVYKRGVTDLDRMTDLSRDLRARLQDEFTISTPRLVGDETSVDGTRKLVLELADGRRIESVYIPDTPAQTFCISSQVGCAMACGFCLTGKMGLVRNLTAGEIAGQVR